MSEFPVGSRGHSGAPPPLSQQCWTGQDSGTHWKMQWPCGQGVYRLTLDGDSTYSTFHFPSVTLTFADFPVFIHLAGRRLDQLWSGINTTTHRMCLLETTPRYFSASSRGSREEVSCAASSPLSSSAHWPGALACTESPPPVWPLGPLHSLVRSALLGFH